MERESLSGGCRKRPLCPEILPDTMRAAFQMRPYRDQNRRFAQRSNTTIASAAYAPQASNGPLAQEDLGFHPALTYKYSGEREACKVVIPAEAKQSRGIPCAVCN